MGALAGFGSDSVTIVREGTWMDPDPNAVVPTFRRVNVRDPGYSERWSEGISIFHNPHALKPLDPSLFPGAAHHWLAEDNRLYSEMPDDFPMASFTHLLVPMEDGNPQP
jgi:hypothetical protein